jgi:subfamily B ATP-binding cassette protein MsbA
MNPFFRFLKNAGKYKLRIFFAVVCMVGVNIFQFASLGTTVPLMDNVVAKDDIKLPGSVYQTLPTSITDQLDRLVAYLNQVPVKELLLGLAIVLFLSIILKSVFSVSSKLAMESVSQSVVRDLMTSMYSHIQELPVQYFSTNRTGDIISRLTNDVYVVQSTLSARLAQCVTEIFQLPFLIGAAFILNL